MPNDTERLDWLEKGKRDLGWSSDADCYIQEYDGLSWRTLSEYKSSARAAIDAAMTGEQHGK